MVFLFRAMRNSEKTLLKNEYIISYFNDCCSNIVVKHSLQHVEGDSNYHEIHWLNKQENKCRDFLNAYGMA